MKITIAKKENHLLSRVDVSGMIDFEGAVPSNAQLTEALAKELNAGSELIVIKKIGTVFSHQKAKFNAVAYVNAEAKKKIEPPLKQPKKAGEGKAKGGKEESAPAKK
ncbi:MAG: hypothetical protein AB1668_05940 [Nanoarchaeota archaeon]